MMNNMFILRLTTLDDTHKNDILTLKRQVEAFGDLINITEQGRRALTVEIQDLAVLPQLWDKIADIAEINEYEGLKIAPIQGFIKFPKP